MHIGFIGVGSIGGPMARCILGAGHEMTVCDVNQATLASFAAAGARATQNPADCAACDFVIVMVATDAQAENVLFGPSGVASAVQAARPPMVLLMSTVLPATVAKLAARSKEIGVSLIDAPVSGGAVRAEQGKLTILAGGTEPELERARPVLSIMATTIHHCGALGAGASFKLLNNVMGVASTYLMGEVVGAAQKLGLDAALLGQVMESSSGRSFATPDLDSFTTLLRRYGADLAATRANVDVCRKDLHHAVTLIGGTGVDAPFVQALSRAVDEATYEEVNRSWHALG